MSAAALAAGLFALLPGSAEATTAERVFAAVSPSVVVVEAAQQGSGVVVIPGVVATNCHVIGEAGRITVRRGRIGHAASLARSDRDRDVCLLDAPTLDAPRVTMRPAADLRVGAAVYAVGAPQGLELSLSAGLVSQLRGAEGGPLIQTTAPVSPGSSGGGLFDERGALVGLTTFQLGRGQNLNFAVPVEWVASAVNELLAWHRCRAAPEPRCVIDEALATARDISDARIRPFVLFGIAEVQIRGGDISGALATARAIADTLQRHRGLRDIAKALAEAGDFAGAMAAVLEIADPVSRSSALSSIAEAQAKAGDPQASARTFASALATARDIPDPGSRSRALSGIAAAQARAGDGQASTRTFASALATARGIADPFDRSLALTVIANFQAKAGDIAGAMATAHELAGSEWRFTVPKTIAETQAREGDIAGAIATARGIADPYYRSLALSAIAEAEARARDGINTRIIGMAIEVIDGLTVPNARAAALARVASALASPRQEPRNDR